MKAGAKRLIRDENGAAMALAMVLLVVGALIFTPLLGLMVTGLASGLVYEDTMHRLYAADAGVEHALSLLKYGGIIVPFPDYDEYDYSTKWGYDLDDDEAGVGELVNGKSVHVTIENVWMPSGIDAPDAATARQIIEEADLIIAGNPSVSASSTYEIKLSYDTGCEGPGAAQVETLGVWLPPDFGYAGNCSLEGEDYYSEPAVVPCKAGSDVVWSFSSPVAVSAFPESITFQYSGPEGKTPGIAASWIDTSEGYAWDADIKVYKITSTATDPDTGKRSTVESYSSKIEPRKLGSTISGDYYAIGNTLMTSSGYPYYPYYRNRLFNESSASLAEGDIPSNAAVEAAWLYWSGWIEEAAEQTIVFQDSCFDFSSPPVAWTDGDAWDTYSGRFRGTTYNKGYNPGRYLAMSSSIDLSAYMGQTVEVSWQQAEDGDLEDLDRLYYAFSKDGGSTWSADYEAFRGNNPPTTFTNTIPGEYVTNNFKMRFYLYGFTGGGWWYWQTEYCYIDDITISVSAQSSVEGAKVNRVMFAGNQVTATQWQVAPTPDAVEGSWCYSCFYDATQIVRNELDPNTKSGTFTLGHVKEGTGTQLYNYPSGTMDGTTGYPLATPASSTDLQYQWSYAGWSLIIIYSSPETKGHQLYLFDTLRYVAVHTTLDFPIAGFLVPDPIAGEEQEDNAAHMTCFVGDGDEQYPYDFIALLHAKPSVPSYEIPDALKLWDGITCSQNSASNPDNVWNSQSTRLAASGVDIDNFDITWSSGLLEPGDSGAWVVLGNASSNPSAAELIMVVYIIISFRTETTGGGIMSYLIRG